MMTEKQTQQVELNSQIQHKSSYVEKEKVVTHDKLTLTFDIFATLTHENCFMP